jgi:hypothetical protein
MNSTDAGRVRPGLRLSGFSLYLLVAALSLASSALAGRLIPQHIPRAHDEFAYLLAGRTFSHFELTNPTPVLWRFFEAQHILLHPSYIAKYPPGQGLALAAGFWLGQPVYGVWLSCALFAAAVTWMLRGFFSPRWAFLGGALAIIQLGLLHYWAQSYWGGALTAAGGALVFGGARRVWRQSRKRDAALLGLGVVILMLTRPFEGLFACAVPGAIVLVRAVRLGFFRRATLSHLLLPFAAVVLAGGLFLAYYQFRVTGSPWRSPYLAYEQQYSGAPIFVWQKFGPEPAFQNASLRDYYREYVVPMSRLHSAPLVSLYYRWTNTAGEFTGVLLGAAAVLGLGLAPGRWKLLALASLAVVAVPLAVCYWFGLHYQAPAAALYLFLAVAGLRALFFVLPRAERRFVPLAAGLLVLQFWIVGSGEFNAANLEALTAPTLRQKFLSVLQAAGGGHLIFVRLEKPYDPNLSWVYNDARLNESAVIWAWDRGPEENRRLLAAYPGRHALVMTLKGEHISFMPVTP